jgi:hypothetical protein
MFMTIFELEQGETLSARNKQLSSFLNRMQNNESAFWNRHNIFECLEHRSEV